MPTQVQFRRGTTAQNNNFTGAAGEISINSSNNTIRVHDGATPGGFELAKIGNVSLLTTSTSAQLASVISDETGSGSLVFSTSPALTGTVTVEELSATGNITSPYFYSQSDANLKKDVTPLVGALSFVQALNGVNFTWKHNDIKAIGLIAQEVEQILPGVVGTSPEGYKTVQYNSIIAILVEAIKDQQLQINDLKKQIDK